MTLANNAALTGLAKFFRESATLSQSSELEAILSHWIQSPTEPPPLMPEATFAFLKELRGCQVWQSSDIQYELVFDDREIPYPPPRDPIFKFIDLFAGIGGFRIAMQSLGGKCVFSCEWDKFAKKTYVANFGEVPYGDVHLFTDPGVSDRELDRLIPYHDVLCAGFPCQPFSLAGVSKKESLGRKHGFEDETQGTLFFDIARIIKVKKPKAFFLENVKNLLSHNRGKTFEVIRRTLEDELDYVVNWNVVDGSNWCSQHRERVFIVGYDPDQITIGKDEIVIPQTPPNGYDRKSLSEIIQEKVDDAFTLGPGTWDTLVRHRKHHESIGQGFGYSMHTPPFDPDEVTRTISARYHKDGAEALIAQPGSRPRKLTIQEAMQLQGLDPERFDFSHVSRTQAYRQIGNSVVLPAVKEAAAEIAKVLKKQGGSNGPE